MKNCDVRKLQLYLDGELAENSTRQLEAHICGCPVCRRELSVLRQLGGVIGDFPEFSPSPAIRLTAKARTSDICPQIIQQISGFLEGALGGSQREMLGLHFALCPNCREELAAQKQLRALTAALPEQAPPEKIRLTVQEALRQRRRERLARTGPWLRTRRFVTTAAMVVAAVALAWVFPNLSVNNRQPESAVTNSDSGKNVLPPIRLTEQPPAGPAPMEEHNAEVVPTQPKVLAEAPPAPSEERIAFVPVRPRNLGYRHVSLPGRIVDISNTAETPVEMAALDSIGERSHSSDAASPVTSPIDPTAIAAARQDLLRGSEQYRVLQMERVLSQLPGPEHLINTPINDSKKPIKEPDASNFDLTRFA